VSAYSHHLVTTIRVLFFSMSTVYYKQVNISIGKF